MAPNNEAKRSRSAFTQDAIGMTPSRDMLFLRDSSIIMHRSMVNDSDDLSQLKEQIGRLKEGEIEQLKSWMLTLKSPRVSSLTGKPPV